MKNNKKHYTNKVIIYGKHPVMAAIANQERKNLILYTSNKTFKPLRDDLKINYIDNREIDKILGENLPHGGYLLESSPKPVLSIHEFIRKDKNKTDSIIVALDQITDPHNIGAIIRSAVAFGVSAILIPAHNSNITSPVIAKSSSGTLENIDIIYETNLANSLQKLKQNGYWTIGLDGSAEKDIRSLPHFNKKVIILGSEGKGLRPLVIKECDELAKIQISDKVESLNVSNAAAICLYAFNTQ